MCSRIPPIITETISETAIPLKDLPSLAFAVKLTRIFTQQVTPLSSAHSPKPKSSPSGTVSLKRKAPSPTSSSCESDSMIDEQLGPTEHPLKKRKTFEDTASSSASISSSSSLQKNLTIPSPQSSDVSSDEASDFEMGESDVSSDDDDPDYEPSDTSYDNTLEKRVLRKRKTSESSSSSSRASSLESSSSALPNPLSSVSSSAESSSNSATKVVNDSQKYIAKVNERMKTRMKTLYDIYHAKDLTKAKKFFPKIFKEIEKMRVHCNNPVFDTHWDRILIELKKFYDPVIEPPLKKRKISHRIGSSTSTSSSSSGSLANPIDLSSSDEDSDDDLPLASKNKPRRSKKVFKATSKNLQTSSSDDPEFSDASSEDDSEVMESNSLSSLSSSTTQSQIPKLSIDKQKKLSVKTKKLITTCQKLIDNCKKQDSLEKSLLESVKKSLNIAILAIRKNLIQVTSPEFLFEKTYFESYLPYLENVSKNIEKVLKEGSPTNRFIFSGEEPFSLIPKPPGSECKIQ